MIKVYVMETCPDCSFIKQQAKNDLRFQIIDIGDHVKNLKEFLSLRDNNPVFKTTRKNGSIGIPCFLLEDGSITFSYEEINISKTTAIADKIDNFIEEGSSCSIDGKGC